MPKNLAYVVGGDYWLPCYVSLYSCLYNNQNLDFNIYILSEEDIDEEFSRNISQLEEEMTNFEFEFIQVDESRFESLPTPKHFTIGIYFKLYLHELLPIDNGNVLYLDCDTIVDGPINQIYETDLGDHIAAVIPNFRNKSIRLGLDFDARYFNVGSMYINLDQWRESRISNKSIEYINLNQPKLPEQYALNYVLNDDERIYVLDPKYNATRKWQREFQKSGRDPVIIHYSSSEKPWDYNPHIPFWEKWWEYCEKTPYRNRTPNNKSLKTVPIKQFQKKQIAIKNFVSKKLEPYPTLHTTVSRFYSKVSGK